MHSRRTDLLAALGLDHRRPELVAIVGGGGKSSLMFELAARLPGRVVTTTTTRIFASQRALAAEVCGDDPAVLEAALSGGTSGLLVVGPIEGDRAAGIAPALAEGILRHPAVDAVVLEADGSRMRPAKAPAAHEPVVPDGATLVVAVAGIDALGGPIAETCHRPERVAALTGLDVDARLTPAALGRLLAHPDGGMKGVPAGARTAVLLNKVENDEALAAAREAAETALASGRVERVVIGALQRAADGFEVREPESLAAGAAG